MYSFIYNFSIKEETKKTLKRLAPQGGFVQRGSMCTFMFLVKIQLNFAILRVYPVIYICNYLQMFIIVWSYKNYNYKDGLRNEYFGKRKSFILPLNVKPLLTVTCMQSGGISKRNPVRPAGEIAQGLTCHTAKTLACHITIYYQPFFLFFSY